MQFSPSLPPSTGSVRAINLDRLEMGYTSIAESINNLAYQQRIRPCIDINRDLQEQVLSRAELMRTVANELLISTFTQTITDLEQERVMSRDYEQYVSTRIRTMLDRELRMSSVSGSSDINQSESMDNADI